MLCKYPIEIKSSKHGEHVIRDTASMLFPCGKCMICRISRSLNWANRILLEVQSHEKNSFVTLTYNNFFVPIKDSLLQFNEKDMELFFKKLRKRYPKRQLSYFYCAEYGSENGRPHYHIALFGVGQDEIDVIKSCWTFVYKKEKYPLGFVYTGELNKHTARYITGYILKGANYETDKKNSKDKKAVDKVEKHLCGRRPEFQRMSRNPAIGVRAIEKIASAAKGRRFKKINYKGKEILLPRTLQRKADKITDSYNNGDDYDLYINKLFADNFKEGCSFKDRVVLSGEGKRKAIKAKNRFYGRDRRGGV